MSPSVSASFTSTPAEAPKYTAQFFDTVYESAAPTGMSFTGVTLSATVAVFPPAVPSFAR